MANLHKAALILLAICSGLNAQPTTSINLYVKETANIRRFGYPVNARVPFPQGTLPSAGQVKLTLDGKDAPAQFTAESRWPDGSVQWLDVDLNSTLGPGEIQTYHVEYGAGVKLQTVTRGLAVTDDGDSLQVGAVRFRKSAAPLIESVKYRNEDIGAGLNGITVIDATGGLHTPSIDKTEIVKRGPLYVVIKYSGKIVLDGQYSAPVVITVEMPNSKSWVKVTAVVDDPATRLRELAFHTPLALGALPWVWDLGTEHWTYGQLRNASESMTLSETVKNASEWSVTVGAKNMEQPYESLRSAKPVEWGHIQSASEVVAFAMEDVAKYPGSYRITEEGSGQLSFRFAPAAPSTRLTLTVYEHFVNTPVHIGAATSPAAILHPLIAEGDRNQFVLSGVPAK